MCPACHERDTPPLAIDSPGLDRVRRFLFGVHIALNRPEFLHALCPYHQRFLENFEVQRQAAECRGDA